VLTKKECVIYKPLPSTSSFLETALIVRGVCYTAPVYSLLNQDNKPDVADALSKSSSSVGRLALHFRLSAGTPPASSDDFWVYGTAFCVAWDKAKQENILQTAGHNVWPQTRTTATYTINEIYFTPFVEARSYITSPEAYSKCELIYCSPRDIIGDNPITGEREPGVADFAFLRVKLTARRYQKKKPLFPVLPPSGPVNNIAVIAYPHAPTKIEDVFPQLKYGNESPESKYFSLDISSAIFHGYDVVVASFGQLVRSVNGLAASTASTTKGCSGGPVVLIDPPKNGTFCAQHVGYNGLANEFANSNYNQVITTKNAEYHAQYIKHVLNPYIDIEDVPEKIRKSVAAFVNQNRKKGAPSSGGSSSSSASSSGSTSSSGSASSPSKSEIVIFFESLGTESADE